MLSASLNKKMSISLCPSFTQQAEALDSRVRVLSEQLENQMELQRESSHRAKQAEADLMDVQARLRSAEGELAAGDVLRDGFKTDKEMVRITNRIGCSQDGSEM